eukprot:scaffold178499_cov30-Tisochrysis_lutea.AAC.3
METCLYARGARRSLLGCSSVAVARCCALVACLLFRRFDRSIGDRCSGFYTKALNKAFPMFQCAQRIYRRKQNQHEHKLDRLTFC